MTKQEFKDIIVQKAVESKIFTIDREFNLGLFISGGYAGNNNIYEFVLYTSDFYQIYFIYNPSENFNYIDIYLRIEDRKLKHTIACNIFKDTVYTFEMYIDELLSKFPD